MSGKLNNVFCPSVETLQAAGINFDGLSCFLIKQSLPLPNSSAFHEDKQYQQISYNIRNTLDDQKS